MINSLPKSLIEAARQVLEEELTPSEQYSAERMKSNGHSFYMENFIQNHAAPGTMDKFQLDKDTHRKVIRIPVTLNQDDKVEPSHTVHNFLKEKGYNIKDVDSYRKGLVHKEITTGDPDRGIPLRTKFQAYKIGSILKQHEAPDDVVHAYTHDPIRESAKTNEFDLVISHHPHDVYGMSTGRGWTSCAQLRKGEPGYGGPASKHMEDEINNHTHVAYLVKRGGNYDTEAVARLAFKHHTALNAEADKAKTIGTTDYKPKHQTLISEGTVYGQAPNDFRKTAEHEMGKLFPIKNDIYIKNKDVYNDNGSSIHVPTDASLSNEHLDTAWKALDKENKSSLYRHVTTEGKFKSKKLREVQTAMKDLTAEPTGNFTHDFDRIKYALYPLDNDQKMQGITRNERMKEHISNGIGKVMSQFDVNNPEHRQALQSSNIPYEIRFHVFDKLKHNIPLVRTPQDFDVANRYHKVLGNSDAEKINIAPDHHLGDYPMKTLAKAGVLRDANDYTKAYHSTHKISKVKDNWYGHVHHLAQEDLPGAHLALQEATKKLEHSANRGDGLNASLSYYYMNPDARVHYAQQLGHDHEWHVKRTHDYLKSMGRLED